MKTENKCFFSISLENGITITGANPYIVRDFLRNCHIASIYAVDSCKEQERPASVKHYDELGDILLNAIVTLNENLKY